MVQSDAVQQLYNSYYHCFACGGAQRQRGSLRERVLERERDREGERARRREKERERERKMVRLLLNKGGGKTDRQSRVVKRIDRKKYQNMN